jgi:ABC-type multidrug transport system ATPase subunit
MSASSARQQLIALSRNKLRTTRRNAKFWLFTFVPPLVVVCIAAFIVDTKAVLARVGTQTPLPSNVTGLFGEAPNVLPYVLDDALTTNNASCLFPRAVPQNTSLVALSNATDLHDFLLHNESLSNGSRIWSAVDDGRPAQVAFVEHACAKDELLNVTVWFNRSADSISLIRAFHWLGESRVRAGGLFGGGGLQESSVPFGSDTVSVFAQLAPMMIGSFAIALSVSAFGVVVVDERQRGLKRQLHMAGVSNLLYWGSHLLLDVAAQATVTALCVSLLAATRGLSGVSFFALLAILLLFAPAAILLCYCISFAFEDAGSAQKWFPPLVNGLVLLSAPLLVSIYFALSSPGVYVLVFIFAVILPFFALFSGFALLVLDQTGPFVAVVFAALLGVVFWGGMLVLFDRRSQRPLKKAKEEKGVPRWLPPGSTEADDVRQERQLIESLSADEAARRYAVVVRGVKRRFVSRSGSGADKHVMAVRGATFGIERGECFGLLGPNGAGKSTLIGLLSGTIEPDAGSLVVNGCAVPADRHRMYRSIGVCPQFDCLWDLLSGREHLTLFGGVRGLTPAQIAAHEADVCRTLGLDDALMERRVSKLSGGTRRKLTLSIALLGEPSVVWLDEPTTGMDPSARRSTWAVINKLRSPQRTFILTTHNMEEADAICSRIGILADGRLRAIGTTAALKEQHGRGLRVDVTANANDIENVDEFLTSQFAACDKLNDFGVTRHYQIENEPVSRLFATLERERARLKILDFCVSETTLEFVFLHLVAQAERAAADAAAAAAAATQSTDNADDNANEQQRGRATFDDDDIDDNDDGVPPTVRV